MKLAQRLTGTGKLKWGVVLLTALAAAGCETKSFFDPSEMGRYKKDPLLQPILSSLDTGVEEPNDEFLNATDARPEDLTASSNDYTIGKNDMINISLTDVTPGQETVKTARVSESGNVSLPLLGQVNILGLTEAQAEQKINKSYRDANLIQNAQVAVTVAEARARTFEIRGSVGSAGEYQILKSDFRLLDALVLARDVTSPTPYNLYIIRKTDEAAKPQSGTTGGSTQPAGDLLAPHSDATSHDGTKRVALLQTAGGDAIPKAPSMDAPVDQPRAVTVEGKPLTPGSEQAASQPAEGAATAKGFEFNEASHSGVRVIRIPMDALLNGDQKYNVVIHAGDFIDVPAPVVGEFYMGGHVARPGVYSLSGRKITLKQAVISAGMLDQVAIPARTEIHRRIGPDREIFARVDLDKIFAGEQADIFLKPYDDVMVGTNAIAPFLAAGRGAFRITYGFGFLYDRNYSTHGNNGG